VRNEKIKETQTAHGAPLFGPRLTAAAFLIFLFVSHLASPTPARSDFSDGDDQAPNATEKIKDEAPIFESATVQVAAFNIEKFGFSTVGFMVADGLIVTTAHPLLGADPQNIFVGNHQIPFTKAKISAVSFLIDADGGVARDFLLLSFVPPADFEQPVLTLAYDVEPNDRVTAWGYPSDYVVSEDETVKPAKSSFTEGAVDAIQSSDPDALVILHSAELIDGVGGGPLVNDRGEVVGMNLRKRVLNETDAISEALPASKLGEFLIASGVAPKLSQK
jgi:S1-C subfamily serine protease